MGGIRWSLTSLADLEEIAEYIAKDSPFYAIAFTDRIIDTIEQLKDFPLKGRMVPELGREDLRELLFGNYRLIYRSAKEGVVIVAIHHSKRDLLHRSRKEDWEI